MRILVTGCAGFIGYHCALALLRRGDTVVGIDSLNSFDSRDLKMARLAQLEEFADFKFECEHIDLSTALRQFFARHGHFDRVLHLAAQAGVRESRLNPHAFTKSNLVGFANILECCRAFDVEHLVYASSSSVYGKTQRYPPSCESEHADRPQSYYAATKRANELMAHAYFAIGLKVTGLRYFTVYGPWGRPDMALTIFATRIAAGERVTLNLDPNGEEPLRDYTYIDDIVSGTVLALDRIGGAALVMNLGYGQPIPMRYVAECIARRLGRKFLISCVEGTEAVRVTCADWKLAESVLGWKPTVSFEEGVTRYVEWHRQYYRV